MLSRMATVAKDAGVGTTSSHESVGQHWQMVEGPIFVYALGQLDHSRSQPGGVPGDGAERQEAEEVMNQMHLLLRLGCPKFLMAP
jgi:hypothetical protein